MRTPAVTTTSYIEEKLEIQKLDASKYNEALGVLLNPMTSDMHKKSLRLLAEFLNSFILHHILYYYLIY